MPLDAKVYLYDILRACDAIAEFVDGKSFEDYQESLLQMSTNTFLCQISLEYRSAL